jgi:hypothetical protein
MLASAYEPAYLAREERHDERRVGELDNRKPAR